MLKLLFLFMFIGAVRFYAIELSGAGATFPEPLYSAMFYEYKKATGVSVNYQGIGSGGGIRQLIHKTIDFGGSDVRMTEKELREAGNPVVHIPVCVGAVVLTYNLPGVRNNLNLTPELISRIFQGKISMWNDPDIAKINPGINLPDIPVVPVVHRSDASGTTYLFTFYLSENDPGWEKNVGFSKSIKWPAGIGAQGNSGVARYVQKIPGSIGYVELTYAEQSKMPMVSVQNDHGNFVKPSLRAIMRMPKNGKKQDQELLQSDSADFYPITAMSWIILYRDQSYGGRSREKARELLNLLWWMIHDGQKINEIKDYGSLSAAVTREAEDRLKSVVYHDEKILK